VTEMRQVKHAYEKGVMAQRGLSTENRRSSLAFRGLALWNNVSGYSGF